MSRGSKDSPVSAILVDESFASQDDRFVEKLRTVRSFQYLAGLADRWKKDLRPWARLQILEYLALPLDRPGHHPIVKRLFKAAEANRDHEVMAAFMVAFDRLIRRQRRTRYHYDWETRQSWQEEELYFPRDQIPGTPKGRDVVNPITGWRTHVPGVSRTPKNGRLFSYRTRVYLRRRVARYFRRMGFMQPTDYVPAVTAALVRYKDDDVAFGENILDNWSLMQIAFRRSPVLHFQRGRVDIADSRSLSELVAAPAFDKLWMQPESTVPLLDLLIHANCRLVIVWAIQLLKRDHTTALRSIGVERLMALLDHANEDVQQFGAALLETLAGSENWSISTWLRLLQTRSVTALVTICQVIVQRVDPQRLTLEQTLGLACARATPVARLGLTWLEHRSVVSEQEQKALGRLAWAECEAVGTDAAKLALKFLGAADTYHVESVSPFFDSRNAQVRRGAWEWLTPESAGYGDAELWSRLLETPYEDVRIRLVSELSRRTSRGAGASALRRHDLSPIWTSVLLGVHRGGRAKLTALRQISQAIADQPDRAERLMSVLAVAIRSVRPPEARAGLAAILIAVSARPDLESLLSRSIPELKLKSGATS